MFQPTSKTLARTSDRQAACAIRRHGNLRAWCWLKGLLQLASIISLDYSACREFRFWTQESSCSLLPLTLSLLPLGCQETGASELAAWVCVRTLSSSLTWPNFSIPQACRANLIQTYRPANDKWRALAARILGVAATRRLARMRRNRPTRRATWWAKLETTQGAHSSGCARVALLDGPANLNPTTRPALPTRLAGSRRAVGPAAESPIIEPMLLSWFEGLSFPPARKWLSHSRLGQSWRRINTD